MTQTEDTRAPAAPGDFRTRLESADSGALRATSIDTLMLNVTLRCDLECSHCHQSSSPSRTEEMSRDTMFSALELARIVRPALLDITGGEPALWPHLRELVVLAGDIGLATRVRTNLLALSHPEADDLPALFASRRVRLLASLPGASAEAIETQRGSAAFDASVAVLRTLADLGYGTGNGLTLDLAYNPPLGELAPPESTLAEQFRQALAPHGVRFDSLYAITNVPVGRYGRRLKAEHGLGAYLSELAAVFNPDVAEALECRHGLVVGWDGTLSDCDFNLGAGLGLAHEPSTLGGVLEALCRADGEAALEALETRRIAFGPHCYACTAGSGSS